MEIVELASDDQRLDEVFAVVAELRPHLDRSEFRRRFEEGYRGGYRFLALFRDGSCRAFAGYRVQTNLVYGRFLYVDDLVTTQDERSRGYGRELVARLEAIASEAGCIYVSLDSGSARTRAHKFYFREGYAITGFHFGKPLV